MTEENKELDPELLMLINNEEDGFNYMERRLADWLENYTLYRDQITINRLTQRQSVNVPLMKNTIRTLLKDIDDMPLVYFENLNNDKQAELFQNSYWEKTLELNHSDLQDIVDKRQVLLFGRSFDQWQIADGRIIQTIQDPQDMRVSRYCDPFDLNTSRFLIHRHIFKPLTTLSSNPDYDKKKIGKLIKFYKTEQGLIKSGENEQALIEKNRKLRDMGVTDIDDPVLGEAWVELTMHFVYRNDEKDESGNLIPEQLFLYVTADNMEILMKKPLEKVIGVTEDHYWRNHYPYVTWADDLERQDFWSDSVGDIMRSPNKVLNVDYSQLTENRTLRNFGMNFYDATVDEDFAPQTFEPKAWGWYPLPGKPSDILEPVQIPDLSESLDEMKFIIEMAEKASGATATQQGVQTTRKVTLGEVELALGEAKERVQGISKFYTPAWKQRAEIFLKLIEAGKDKLDAVKIYKKGKNSDEIFSREISPKDWMTELGYQTKIWSQDEKNSSDTDALQKFNAVKMNMPDNPKLAEIYSRKLLEFLKLPPEEINDIMEYERMKLEGRVGNQAMGVIPQQGQFTLNQPQMQTSTQ